MPAQEAPARAAAMMAAKLSASGLASPLTPLASPLSHLASRGGAVTPKADQAIALFPE